MKLQSDRINSMMSTLRNLSYQDVVAMKMADQYDNSQMSHIFYDEEEIHSSEV